MSLADIKVNEVLHELLSFDIVQLWVRKCIIDFVTSALVNSHFVLISLVARMFIKLSHKPSKLVITIVFNAVDTVCKINTNVQFFLDTQHKLHLLLFEEKDV